MSLSHLFYQQSQEEELVMSSWFIYFITRLDYIQVMETIPLVISVFGFAAGLAVWGVYLEDNNKEMINFGKRLALKIALPIILVTSILLAATPSTKEMAAIYLIPKIVNNEQVQQLPNNALEFLNSELRGWIKDTISPSESTTKDSE